MMRASPAASAASAARITPGHSASVAPPLAIPVSILRCSRAGRPARRPPPRSFDQRGRARGQVDVVADRLLVRRVRHREQAQHRGGQACRAQRQGVGHVHHAQPVRTARQRRSRSRDHAVAVAVRLDHRHELGTAHVFPAPTRCPIAPASMSASEWPSMAIQSASARGRAGPVQLAVPPGRQAGPVSWPGGGLPGSRRAARRPRPRRDRRLRVPGPGFFRVGDVHPPPDGSMACAWAVRRPRRQPAGPPARAVRGGRRGLAGLRAAARAANRPARTARPRCPQWPARKSRWD